MKTHLFICKSGLDRSPCAVELYKDSEEYEAKSCGILSPLTENPITDELVSWADEVIILDKACFDEFKRRYPKYPEEHTKCIPIPDLKREDPKLREMLEKRLKRGEWLKSRKDIR